MTTLDVGYGKKSLQREKRKRNYLSGIYVYSEEYLYIYIYTHTKRDRENYTYKKV